MKLHAVVAGAVLALAASTAQAQSGSAKVDPSLEAANKKWTETFNTLDPKAVSAFFAADGTLITPLGKVAHGPAEVAKVFEEDAAKMFKGTTSTFTITGSRKVGADTVWLDVDHVAQNAKMPDGTTGTLKHHVVVLAQKKGNDWKWLEVRPYMFIPRDHPPTGETFRPTVK